MKVTYYNHLTESRKVLIDELDLETARRVAAKWGNPDEPHFYLPEVRIETDEGEVVE